MFSDPIFGMTCEKKAKRVAVLRSHCVEKREMRESRTRERRVRSREAGERKREQ